MWKIEWTVENVTKLQEAFDDGLPLEAIAENFGTGVSAIKRALTRHYPNRQRRHGPKALNTTIDKIKRLYDDGAPYQFIANQLGMSLASVASALNRHYPERTRRIEPLGEFETEQFHSIIGDYRAGISFPAMEAKYGIKEHILHARFKKYRQMHPVEYAALREVRDPIVEARQRANINANRKHVTPNVRLPTLSNNRAWTPLDDAIRTLQRDAPCYRDPQGRGIIYGTRLKTPDEILRMAERRAA